MQSRTKRLDGPRDTERPQYAERLWVPVGWWAFAMFIVASLWVAYAFAVDALWVHGAGVAAVALTAAGLLAFGRCPVVVDRDSLTAAGDRLPREAIGRVTALSSAQARALRGPGADATARLIVRPYLPRAVCVELTGTRPEPYWYVATRHPDRLAAALAGLADPSQGADPGGPADRADLAPRVQDFGDHGAI